MDSDPLGFQSHDVRVDVVLALLQSASGMGITTFIQDEAQPVGTNPFENGGDEFAEEAPPPAYESVMMSDSLLMSNGGPLQPEGDSNDFEIMVAEPVKQGEGVGAYVSYKVVTKTTMPQYRSQHHEVIRRFRDFAWLHGRLAELNRGVIIPPLPEKSVVQKYQMTTDFIEQRRAALTLFINKVAAHPVLKASKDLQLFLEASEDEWSLEVSRAIAEANLNKPKFSSVAQIFKGLQHSTANLVAGRTDDEDEDPEYIKVREYINQLEAHLAEAHRQSARLIKRQAELGQAVQEWGKAMEALGRFEDGPIADGCMHLSEKSDCLARMLSDQAATLGDSFESPLKEFVRTIRAAKATIADRAAALASLSQARSDVEVKRGRLAKLRGTPGIREEKAAEAERELNEAQQRVEKTKKDFEGIAQRMAVELARFQRERAQEMAVVLRDFSVAQAQLSSDINNVWRALLPALVNIPGGV